MDVRNANKINISNEKERYPNVCKGNVLETGSSTFTFSNSKYERTRGLSPVVLLLKQNSLETE